MRRREFIKISSAAVLPFLISCRRDVSSEYDIQVFSDMPTGHLTFISSRDKTREIKYHDILIVGGGISGLAAASELKNEDFILYELSREAGGTSGSISINGNRYAQGAHYDLAYPDYYGKEALSFLEDLKVIQFNPFNKLWEFRDKQYLVNPLNESRCLADGEFRQDVIPDGPEREKFQAMLDPFRNTMKMPTRLISPEYHYLNQVSFLDFINGTHKISQEFRNAVDYNMLDDFGGTTAEISALAGIHYYQCRPYFYQPVELFSPPQGNYYFIEKMLSELPKERIQTGYLVRKITKNPDGFEVNIVDTEQGTEFQLRTKKIIYAGGKHAIKHVLPEEFHLFSEVKYAPWLVINFVLNQLNATESFWQNEILEENPNLLGFVDSQAQYRGNREEQVLTAYYCFKPSQRLLLAKIEENKNRIIRQTIRYMSKYYNTDMSGHIRNIYVKVLGHAMPVPRPGFLFNDKNKVRAYKDLIYAGVDNSRLPLLFEAIDSGIMAANLIRE
jgi:protoporphyrinogen oxidase